MKHTHGYAVVAALMLALTLGSCLQPISESSEDTAEQGADTAADLGSARLDPDIQVRVPLDITSDVPSPACEPACPAWQLCKAAQCVEKACTAHAECNPPTPDPEAQPMWCFKGLCKGYQCAVDGDCGPGQACNTLQYLCYDKPTGCTGTAQCDDKNPCTVDNCPPSGNCEHEPIFACCTSVGDCDDESDCTVDTCDKGQCSWAPKGLCCKADKDCDDGKPCTQDLCNGGVCSHKSAPACCLNAAECDDGDPDSADTCTGGKCQHVWKGLNAKCPAGTGCTANNCAVSICSAELCSYAPPPKLVGCCTADAQCAKDVTCTADTCQALVCLSQKVSGPGTHHWARFDEATLGGWTIEKSSASVYFHFDTMSKVGGAGALRYGVPGKVTFEDQTPNKGAAFSPAWTVPKAAGLSFWALLDASPGAAIHQCGVDAVDAKTGATLAALWSKSKDLNTGTTGAKWLEQKVAIPAALEGKSVKLKVWFDQVKWDTSNKSKLGFLVDELELTGFCP